MSNAASDCDRSLNLKLPHIKNIFFVSSLLLRVTDLGECFFFIYIFIHLRQTRNEADISVCKLGQWTLRRQKKANEKKNCAHKKYYSTNVVEWVREREEERRMKETLNDIMNERGEKIGFRVKEHCTRFVSKAFWLPHTILKL